MPSSCGSAQDAHLSHPPLMDDAPPPYDKSKSRPTLGEKTFVSSASKSAAFLHVSKKRSAVKLFRKTPQSEVPSDGLVKAAIQADLKTLVQPYTTDSVPDRLALLEACSRLCVQQKLDFSALLQGKSIGNYSALYWAIANGPWPPQPPFELVGKVLSHSAPLTAETIREARRACVSLRSQEMFQFLRMSPEFGALSTEDRVLLGPALVPPEDIAVEEMEGHEQPFSVRFHIPMFQKRMLLGKRIVLEFIARGRLWQLKFYTSTKPAVTTGGWSGSLQMVENSPMTPILFGVVFLDARPSPSSPTPFFRHHGKKDSILYVPGEVEPEANGITFCSWWMFQHDSVCIASDGSVTGILGVKLVAEDAPKTSPKTIPTTPDEQCVIA